MAADPPTYAARLRIALERDGWSQLRLVRGLADRTGNAVDSERSAVRGYLKGNLPRPERAQLIAEITGVPELGVVDDPRRSATARFEEHLARLEAHQEALATELARLIESHLEIHAKLDQLLAAVADGFQQRPGQSTPGGSQ